MTMPISEVAGMVPNRHGEPLYNTVTLPQCAEKMPILLILHGFKGFRNYSFLPWIAQIASTHNVISIRMCFSRNGMKNTSWWVQDVEAFASNTISREVDDVHDIISLINTDNAYEDVREHWNGKLYLIGHSRGGGIAQIVSRELHTAGADVLVRTLVLNSVGTWRRWTPRQRAAWEAGDGMSFRNERTQQVLRMDLTYAVDVENNADRLSLINAAQVCGDTLAFVHAEADLTVPLSEIKTLIASSGTTAPLFVISNTTHTLGMTHPVERLTKGFISAVDVGFSWLFQ